MAILCYYPFGERLVTHSKSVLVFSSLSRVALDPVSHMNGLSLTTKGLEFAIKTSEIEVSST